MVIEAMDLVFTVDSIPAVFAITTDEFIIYTSNICAILGLRSLYFVLAHIIDRFVYLKTGLAIVLSFVGVKMLIAEIFHVPTWGSLAFIITVLGVSTYLSLRATRHRRPGPPRSPPTKELLPRKTKVR